MNKNEKEKKSIVPKISNFISRSIIYPSFKGAKSINKRSNLSNDTRLKGVERNNERVNRRFNVAGGEEERHAQSRRRKSMEEGKRKRNASLCTRARPFVKKGESHRSYPQK